MPAKVILFDLETTNLKANFGILLAGAYKILGEKKIHTVSIASSPNFEGNPTDDKWVVKKMREALMEADVVVGWYSKYFDFPFLQTRLIGHKLKPLPPIPHVDGWATARYKMAINSNRLATVSSFLGVEEKTALSGPIWIKAMSGNKNAIKYVVKHCKQDVNVLEQVYLRIRPLITNHPNVNLVDGKKDSCPNCGVKGKLQSRGYQIARTTKKRRYQCMSCGSWATGRAERTGVEIR